jgi:uncharacterized protein YjbJ (UPF0337 family)
VTTKTVQRIAAVLVFSSMSRASKPLAAVMAGDDPAEKGFDRGRVRSLQGAGTKCRSAALFGRTSRQDNERTVAMGSTSDKVKGKVNEAAGKVRQAIGRAADNQEEQVKGKIQETKGKAQVAKGEVKDAVKKVVDRA